jgi:hypothetical protein
MDPPVIEPPGWHLAALPPNAGSGEVHEYVLAGLPQRPGCEATHFVVRCGNRLMERLG